MNLSRIMSIKETFVFKGRHRLGVSHIQGCPGLRGASEFWSSILIICVRGGNGEAVVEKEAEKVRMLGEQYERLQSSVVRNAMLFSRYGNHLQTHFSSAQAGENEKSAVKCSRIASLWSSLQHIFTRSGGCGMQY